MENNLKYMYLNHLPVHLKLTQNCKSTTLQFKKKENHITERMNKIKASFLEKKILKFLNLWQD